LKKAFKGHQESGSPPTPLTGIDIYEKVNNIHQYLESLKRSHMWQTYGRRNQYSFIFCIDQN